MIDKLINRKTHKNPQTHAHTYTFTHMHTCTHTYAHTHTHIRTHTHTYAHTNGIYQSTEYVTPVFTYPYSPAYTVYNHKRRHNIPSA